MSTVIGKVVPDLVLKQHVDDIVKILTTVGSRYKGGRLASFYQQCYNLLDEWIKLDMVLVGHIIGQYTIRGSGKYQKEVCGEIGIAGESGEAG